MSSLASHRARETASPALSAEALRALCCDPELALALRAQYAGVKPGYHLNKRHWITIDLQCDVQHTLVRQPVEDSYDLVRPRSAARDRASRRDQGATK